MKKQKTEIWVILIIISLIVGGILGTNVFSKSANPNTLICQDYKLMSSQPSQWFTTYTYNLGDDCRNTFGKQDCVIKVLRTMGNEVDYNCWCK